MISKGDIQYALEWAESHNTQAEPQILAEAYRDLEKELKRQIARGNAWRTAALSLEFRENLMQKRSKGKAEGGS